MGAPAKPSKVCARCGRAFEWRKKWAKDWDEVRYCSAACRRAKLDDTDAALEQAILQLLDERKADSTICPSEAARRVGADREIEWRPLMEPTRRAARRLVARGELEITQKGRVVAPETAKGAIRLRRPR